MALEILHAQGSGRPRSFDIVLVHGIFVGAWVWEPHFMPYLAEAGYNVHALSLSGHGESDGHERLQTLSLRDYRRDLIETASAIGRPVVAVGHSMGGAVVQSAVRAGAEFAGVTLMASVPPGGLMLANVAMMWQQPALWRELAKMFSSGLKSADMDVLREGLFSNRIDEREFAAFAARGGNEGTLIGFELQGLVPFAPAPWKAPPTLVMGGSEDRFVRLDDLRATASWYGTEAMILPGMSHVLMLDPAWKKAADGLLAWLETLAPEQSLRADLEPQSVREAI